MTLCLHTAVRLYFSCRFHFFSFYSFLYNTTCSALSRLLFFSTSFHWISLIRLLYVCVCVCTMFYIYMCIYLPFFEYVYVNQKLITFSECSRLNPIILIHNAITTVRIGPGKIILYRCSS